MKLGLQEAASGGGFVRPRCALGRRMRTDGRDLAGCFVAQAGRAAAALCRPRPTLRPGWQSTRAREQGRAGCRFGPSQPLLSWAEKRKE